jgi:DNA-binding transcriptional LysR family regulator
VIGFSDTASNAELGRWSDEVARDATMVMRCSTQSDILAAVQAGIGISVLSCVVGDAHPDLVRVAPNKLAGISDMWLLVHPDLVNLPAVRAVIDFVTVRANADAPKLRGILAT